MSLAERILKAKGHERAVDATLKTDERVLARITDGIYRQPSSALRELISNAYDADASEIVILTDAPRFGCITVRDNGMGFTPEALEVLVEHIGGSAKRTRHGADIGVTSPEDPTTSPGGRTLIGKLGIGIFSVAQFTRHFLIITKTYGARYRTVADVTLGAIHSEQRLLELDQLGEKQIETGRAKIWIEPAQDPDAHGTEIKLVELLPRTRSELASADHWAKIDFEKELGAPVTKEPRYHIGRVFKDRPDEHQLPPHLPWQEADEPRLRFEKLVAAIRDEAADDENNPSLETTFDNYLRMLWTVSLGAPLEYLNGHPFDLTSAGEIQFFSLENKPRGQSHPLKLAIGETPRKALGLISPGLRSDDRFSVFIDGVQLLRPLVYREQQKTSNAIKNPLLFLGKCEADLKNVPEELRGGPLEFEAYLFWTPKVVPKEHQGVLVRIGNASGTLFDPTFMGYQVSEQTRLRQITAEIFVTAGLDGAINIDRESFNTAHFHYQAIVVWLHSAIRQLTNRQKEIGKQLRQDRLNSEAHQTKEELAELAKTKVKDLGVEDPAEVIMLASDEEAKAAPLRRDGKLVLRKSKVIPPSRALRQSKTEDHRQTFIEKKAAAVAQILDAWGLLDGLPFEQQEQLVRDILEVALFGVDA